MLMSAPCYISAQRMLRRLFENVVQSFHSRGAAIFHHSQQPLRTIITNPVSTFRMLRGSPGAVLDREIGFEAKLRVPARCRMFLLGWSWRWETLLLRSRPLREAQNVVGFKAAWIQSGASLGSLRVWFTRVSSKPCVKLCIWHGFHDESS